MSVVGIAVNDPQHPDYVPSLFSFSKLSDATSEKKLARFNAAKRRDNTKKEIPAKKAKTNDSEQQDFENVDNTQLEETQDVGIEQNEDYKRAIEDLKEEIKKCKAEHESEKSALERKLYLAQINFEEHLRKPSGISYEAFESQSSKFFYFTGIHKEKFDKIF